MSATPKDARSGIDPRNWQETMDAASSAAQALQGGQQQYPTPVGLARFLNGLLPRVPVFAFDPQCAAGNTFANIDRGTHSNPALFGCELDNRWANDGGTTAIRRITGNCVAAWAILDDLWPDAKIECQVANPPFGIRWKTDAGNVDSTEYTWRKMMERAPAGGFGWFLANSKTIEKLGIHRHDRVYLYQKFPVGVWKGCGVAAGVVHFHVSNTRPERLEVAYAQQGTEDAPEFPDLTEHSTALSAITLHYQQVTHTSRINDRMNARAEWGDIWNQLGAIMAEEAKSRAAYNFWLDRDGRLGCYLSTRTATKRKLSKSQLELMHKLEGSHPLSLTVARETRSIMRQLIDEGIWTIQPAADAAIRSALAQVKDMATPIMPVTDFERVAYADESDTLECIASEHGFTAGKRYPLDTQTYHFTTRFKRAKLHYSEQDDETYTAQHDCELSGEDRMVIVHDDGGTAHRFLSHPKPDAPTDHPEEDLWKMFAKPHVPTVAETHAEQIAANLLALETCEMWGDFVYYPGQKYFLSRVATKNYGLLAADTGAGKSLMTLSLIQIKGPARALIVAPQGTTRATPVEDDEDGTMGGGDCNASQWMQEIRRFAPGMAAFELFSFEDYERIKQANGGVLPSGVYITYYDAFFKNSARETAPDSWDNRKFVEACQRITEHPFKLDGIPDGCDPDNHWARSVGREVKGIRCVMLPSLSTVCGDQFDFVAYDESHFLSNLDAQVTQLAIRMQPAHKWLLTASPIPNVIDNLFAPLGWLCVPEWYKGERLNIAWPYARHERQRFIDQFRSEERDYTEEFNKKANDKQWRGKCVKVSPIISSPAHLLKLLKPTMAYISKKACNPNLPDAIIHEVRVPMGEQQSELYGHFMNRGNIPHNNPLVRARVQGSYLRAICADPANFAHGGPKVDSNFNPKTVAILELTRDLLAKGQTVVIVCARVGQSDTLARLLTQCGVPISRIDSTVSAQEHSHQANLFKQGRSRVHIMGVKCAMAYSFPDCENMIIGSIEYAPGVLVQAKGRIDRVNSKRRPNIWCILHANSIEETMFQTVATKQDAATICLQGQRVPRDYKPVDASEIMALAYINWAKSGAKGLALESDLEKGWPNLATAIKSTL